MLKSFLMLTEWKFLIVFSPFCWLWTGRLPTTQSSGHLLVHGMNQRNLTLLIKVRAKLEETMKLLCDTCQ